MNWEWELDCSNVILILEGRKEVAQIVRDNDITPEDEALADLICDAVNAYRKEESHG